MLLVGEVFELVRAGRQFTRISAFCYTGGFSSAAPLPALRSMASISSVSFVHLAPGGHHVHDLLPAHLLLFECAHDLASIEDREAVGHRKCVVDVMGDEDGS